jgi:hypothetical protein
VLLLAGLLIIFGLVPGILVNILGTII